jgi:hypothetical protein
MHPSRIIEMIVHMAGSADHHSRVRNEMRSRAI